MIRNGTIELYGQFINLSQSKIETNAIKCVFQRTASNWYKEVNSDFYKIFSDLDALYKNGDDFAHRVRLKSIEEGMAFLTANGIYDIAERQFYEQFMSSHDTWTEEFDVIASQYEAIVERTAELDAYRTARRQSRRQWVGYGSTQAVADADGRNLTSNVGHGVFNLMAKGITAIGNSFKKDEIFKSPATLKTITNGIHNIVMAAFEATIDAVNSRSNNVLYNYTAEEISKAEAIIENINKGRIPKDNILSSLMKALEFYPYNRSIYSLLLSNFGGDESRLDKTVAYFGLTNLSAEKKQLFDARRARIDLVSLSSCKSNIPELEKYAKYICYDGFITESERLLKAAIKREFENNLNSITLKTVSDCKVSIPILIDFANEIGYQGFEKESIEILNRAIESDFKLEASKYTFTYIEDCDSHLPKLEAYAKEIEYTKFEEWSNQIRGKAKPTPSIKANSPDAEGSGVKSGGFTTIIILVVVAILVWMATRDTDSIEESAVAEPVSEPLVQEKIVEPVVLQESDSKKNPETEPPYLPIIKNYLDGIERFIIEKAKNSNDFQQGVQFSHNYFVSDVNDDGTQDVVLSYYVCEVNNCHITKRAYGIAVFTNTSNTYELSAEGPLNGYNVEVIASGEKGIIQVNSQNYTESDPTCCPSNNTSERYRLNGNELVLVP